MNGHNKHFLWGRRKTEMGACEVQLTELSDDKGLKFEGFEIRLVRMVLLRFVLLRGASQRDRRITVRKFKMSIDSNIASDQS